MYCALSGYLMTDFSEHEQSGYGCTAPARTVNLPPGWIRVPRLAIQNPAAGLFSRFSIWIQRLIYRRCSLALCPPSKLQLTACTARGLGASAQEPSGLPNPSCLTTTDIRCSQGGHTLVYQMLSSLPPLRDELWLLVWGQVKRRLLWGVCELKRHDEPQPPLPLESGAIR
jgi:hypothetical protein